MRAYYFGCVGQAGHYMHTPDLRTDRKFVYDNPWRTSVDNGLIPKDNSRFALHFKDGWTALAFVDNTVDRRPGSNSVFLVEGNHSIEEMVEIAKLQFPTIAARVGLAESRAEKL